MLLFPSDVASERMTSEKKRREKKKVYDDEENVFSILFPCSSSSFTSFLLDSYRSSDISLMPVLDELKILFQKIMKKEEREKELLGSHGYLQSGVHTPELLRCTYTSKLGCTYTLFTTDAFTDTLTHTHRYTDSQRSNCLLSSVYLF